MTSTAITLGVLAVGGAVVYVTRTVPEPPEEQDEWNGSGVVTDESGTFVAMESELGPQSSKLVRPGDDSYSNDETDAALIAIAEAEEEEHSARVAALELQKSEKEVWEAHHAKLVAKAQERKARKKAKKKAEKGVKEEVEEVEEAEKAAQKKWKK